MRLTNSTIVFLRIDSVIRTVCLDSLAGFFLKVETPLADDVASVALGRKRSDSSQYLKQYAGLSCLFTPLVALASSGDH
jgi:hypothetical protein